MKPGVTYDPEADVMYIRLAPYANFHRYVEVSESVILDIDLDGEVMGIEILSPPPEITERFSE